MNILIYSNCAGDVITSMFENHPLTKDKYKISFFHNYENLHKNNLEHEHKKLLNECDIFIYQPMNKNYDYSEYDIGSIQKYLKNECKILRVNYYRTRAFWYNSTYIPYNRYGNYSFHTNYGIHNDFINLKNKNDKKEIVEFINNIQIDKEEIINFFDNEVEKFKILDEKSDVKMYNFFKLNYNNNLLFFDPFHPTNIFFYEIFRQLIKLILNYELPEKDLDFLNEPKMKDVEMTNWTLPILPLIKTVLKLNYEDIIPCFHKQTHPKRLYMNTYDNYYIRLSPNNFKNYLDELERLDVQMNTTSIQRFQMN